MFTDILDYGGAVVDENFKGVVEFLVTAPTKFMNFQPLHKAKEVVTNLWLEDVITARSEIPIEYYHRVISVRDDKVLQGITCTISTYEGAERTFMTVVCEALGASVDDSYEKKNFPVLICPKAEGSTYKAALFWDFPVVTKEWLLDTYKKSCLYKLEDYLLGDSKWVPKYRNYIELNKRGIHKGTEPPLVKDGNIICPLLSKVSPSPAVVRKRKSLLNQSNVGAKCRK